jgi:hypothetical protein
VTAALEPLLTSGLAWVSPHANGWVSVYPESTEKQEPREMESLASALSAALATRVLGVLVHDSDILRLWVYADGGRLDTYDSREGDAADRNALAGLGPPGTRPDAVTHALAGGATKQAVDPAQLADMKQRLQSKLEDLRKSQPRLARQFEGQVEAMLAKLAESAQPVLAESRLAALADLLGIPGAQALAGYNDIEGGEADVPDLTLVPERRAAKRRLHERAAADRRTARREAQRRQGELRWSYEVPRRRGRDPVVRPLGFDADGHLWLAEARDKNGPQTLVVLDGSGQEVARHPHEGLLWTSLSPDGSLLAAITGTKKPIAVRRTADLSVIAELPPTPRGVGAVHMSTNGTHVAVDDFDGSLSFYRLPSGTLARKMEIRGANLRSCGWSGDGRRFARIDGGDVISSDVGRDEGDTLVRVTRHGLRALAACYLPDGERMLVAGDGGAAVFDAESGLVRRLSWSLVGAERTEAFERMAELVGGAGTTGAQLAQTQPQLAQSGRAVAVTARWHAVLAADGVVRFWSAESGEPLGRRDTQQGLRWELHASAEGDEIATGGNPVLCWRTP